MWALRTCGSAVSSARTGVARGVSAGIWCKNPVERVLLEEGHSVAQPASRRHHGGSVCRLRPPAPLVALPLEVVQVLTQLVVAGPDLAKELLNVRDGVISGLELRR